MNNPKVSLTIWWEHVAHQIRIQGFCSLIDPQLADSYWEKRVHDAQVVSYIFDQSQEIESLEAMQQKFLDEKVNMIVIICFVLRHGGIYHKTHTDRIFRV